MQNKQNKNKIHDTNQERSASKEERSAPKEIIKNFLLKDCNNIEISSYKKYINQVTEKENNTLWIEKTSNNRDKILYFEPKCNICNNYINISEYGVCKCNNNHNCYNEIIKIISKIC
jgi:hypothetical protein